MVIMAVIGEPAENGRISGGGGWSHDNSSVVVFSVLHQGELGLDSRVKNENVSVRMIKTHSNEISIPRGV